MSISTVQKPNTTDTLEKHRWFEALMELLLGNNYIKEPQLLTGTSVRGEPIFSTPDYLYPHRRVVIEYKQSVQSNKSNKVSLTKYQAGYYASEVAGTGYPNSRALWWTFGTDGKKWLARPYLAGIPQEPWQTYGYYDLFTVAAQLPPDRPLTDRDRSIWKTMTKNGRAPNLTAL